VDPVETANQEEDFEMTTIARFRRGLIAFALVGTALASAPKQASALNITLGAGTTQYSVVNISSSTVTVVANYYYPNGSPGPQQNFTLNPNARLIVDVSTVSGLPGGWSGSVVLSADQDIVAAAVTRYSGRPNYEPAGGPPRADGDAGTESSAYDAFNNGSTTLYAPLIQRVPRTGGFAALASRITIQNTTASVANGVVNVNREGTPLPPIPFTLQPYGSITFDTANDADPIVIAGLTGGPGQRRASLIVTATQPIAGVVEQNWDNPATSQNWSGGYAMLVPSEAGNTLFSAQAQRECRGATPCIMPNASDSFSAGNDQRRFNTYSSFTLLNTGSATANVQAVFISAQGLPGTYYTQNITLNFTIPPQALFDINLLNGGTITSGNPLFNTLFTPLVNKNFRGSLRVTSDQPLVGIGFFQQPQGDSQNYVSTYNLVSPSGATNRVVIPWVDRDCALTTPCPAPGPSVTVADYNSFSNIVVVNMGSAPATINSVTFYTQTGVSQLVLSPFTLPPGASYSINTRGGGDVPFATMQGLTEKFYGHAVINASAGSQIKAVVSVANSRSSDIYNAMNR
jgi:hypothetical protein